MARKYMKEKYIAALFKITLIIKGADAALEIAAGCILAFVSQGNIVNFVQYITRGELLEDPTDFIANHLVQYSEQVSASLQHFAALYLITHGIIKMVIIIALLKKKAWAYPVSIVIFSLFVAYEIYSFILSQSPWVLILVFLDLLVIVLTIHEYRYKKLSKVL